MDNNSLAVVVETCAVTVVVEQTPELRAMPPMPPRRCRSFAISTTRRAAMR